MNPLLWSGGNHEAASICKAGHVEPCEQDNNFLNFGLFKDDYQMNTFSRSVLLCAISNKLIKTPFLLTQYSITQYNKYSGGLLAASFMNISLNTVPEEVRTIRSIN